jgi:anthranilate phosphoribosyltransferase
MKEILHNLFEHKPLNKAQAKQVLTDIAQAKFNNSQIAAFVTCFLMRTVTVEELEGFREALLELCTPVPFKGFETIDLCGTGGDEKNTFNISTLASFVVAASGIKVTKHGNYGVSSVSGSSNVMEYFGYKFTNDKNILEKQLVESNICFLHAPLFHPALKNVGQVRKELGIKTFFNMLGPLVNPAFPTYQSNGVFSLELARMYNYLLQNVSKNYVVIHSIDGYDEVSLTGPFKVYSRQNEEIIEPESIGFKRIKQEALFGGNTVKEAADIFLDVISGKGTEAQNNAVIINAALAINCAKNNQSLQTSIAEARESLVSERAYKTFKKLIDNQKA